MPFHFHKLFWGIWISGCDCELNMNPDQSDQSQKSEDEFFQYFSLSTRQQLEINNEVKE